MTVGHTITARPARAESVGFEIPIIGTAPLLVAHRLAWDVPGYWDDMAPEVGNKKRKVASAEQATLLRHLEIPYDPEQGLTPEAESHLRGYWLPEARPAFQSSGFMGAIRTAAVQYGGKSRDRISGKKIAAALQLLGDPQDPSLVAILGDYSLREDIGTSAGMGGAPRRVLRLQFATGWRATLRGKHLPRLLSLEQIVQLITWSGDFGVGAWRPSAPKGGTFGTYRVLTVEDTE